LIHFCRVHRSIPLSWYCRHDGNQGQWVSGAYGTCPGSDQSGTKFTVRSGFFRPNPPPPFDEPLYWADMRTNLRVPFAEKDDAKKLGARWDAARKIWFVENKDDMTPFARWIPSTGGTTGPDTAPVKQSSAKPNQSAGIMTVGSNYVKHPRVCDCPPWEVCDLCRATSLPG
jgi:hypothetical protein